VASASQRLHLVLAALGFASLILLWLTVVAGFVLRNSWTQTRIRRPTIYAIHQAVTLVGLSLGVFHGVAQLAVPGSSIALLDLVVPFVDAEDPIGIGVAVAGLELVIVVVLSTLIQRRLGYARWRVIHTLGYAAFMLIVAHVLISGSDVGPAWVWAPVVGAWLVTFVLWLRTLSFMDGLGRRIAGYRFARRRPMVDRPREVVVRVDARQCIRFGFCEHVAPDLFQLRADGELWYRTTVPPEQADGVIRAIEVCPARAITFGDQGMSPAGPPTPPRPAPPVPPVPAPPAPPARQIDRGPDSLRGYGRPRAIPGLRRDTPSGKEAPWDSHADRRTNGS